MERLRTGKRAAGIKQSGKVVKAGRAAAVYAAKDANPLLLKPLLELCQSRGVPVVWVPSMKELAKACRVDVPTACAALLRNANGDNL